MYDVTIVYDNPQTKQLFDMVPNQKGIYVEYLDIRNSKDKSKAFKLKSHWGAKKNPFVVVEKDSKLEKIFYSEGSDDAVNQLIKWINDSKN